MIYTLTEDSKNMLLQLNAKLALVEVKGESVEHLFMARVMANQLINGLKELPEETVPVKEGG